MESDQEQVGLDFVETNIRYAMHAAAHFQTEGIIRTPWTTAYSS
jgi:hypothetical protein